MSTPVSLSEPTGEMPEYSTIGTLSAWNRPLASVTIRNAGPRGDDEQSTLHGCSSRPASGFSADRCGRNRPRHRERRRPLPHDTELVEDAAGHAVHGSERQLDDRRSVTAQDDDAAIVSDPASAGVVDRVDLVEIARVAECRAEPARLAVDAAERAEPAVHAPWRA